MQAKQEEDPTSPTLETLDKGDNVDDICKKEEELSYKSPNMVPLKLVEMFNSKPEEYESILTPLMNCQRSGPEQAPLDDSYFKA